MAQSAALSDSAVMRRDWRVTSLVSISHAASHFYQLALPPLFVLINADLGFSYKELGILTGAFYVASAICQPPSGFLVDRFGARVVLLSGFALMATATLLMGLLPYYPVMFVLSVLAGAGNSVFHPCDYSIMNASVSEKRIARAFSFHMLGGYVGYLAAPVTMALIGIEFGWRTAIVSAGVAGLAIFAVLWARSRDFRDSSHERAEAGSAEAPLSSAIRELLIAPVLLCWVFFLVVAMGQMGLQTFAPTLLKEAWNVDLAAGALAVSILVGGVIAGVLAGGFLADNFRKPDVVVTVGYSIAIVAVLAVWRFDLPTWALFALFALIGFMYGIAFPSRELLVRAATPKGASGRVFGFVYSGMDFGAATTPIVFGWFVDLRIPASAFLFVGVLWVCSILLILMTSAATRQKSAVAAE